MEKINVGIDLGTSFSAIAYFSKSEGKVKIYKNNYGEEVTPSVLCFEKGKIFIGQEAKDEQKNGNLNTISFYKSMIGDPNWNFYIDSKEYSAEELSSIFLRLFVKEIERENNVQIEGAVITVPAYFNDRQREATIRAGERAGLKVLKIINEPTSAIIAYGLTSGKNKNVLVYDLGGGTFDVTIAKVEGTKIDVLATNGNHQLGGKDWDEILFNDIKDRFYDEHGIMLDNYPEDLKELQVKCEEAKKRLTNVLSTQISIQSQGFLGKYNITREDFEDKTESLLGQTLLLIDSCFHDISKKEKINFSWKNIDEVVLVGGSTRMPQVKEMILKEFGKSPITKDINVDTIVAVGAAIQAELTTSKKIILTLADNTINSSKQFKNEFKTLSIYNENIKDITAHSLGMLALSSDESEYINSIIIPKNSNVDQAFSREYNFNGDKLEVFVLQGESRNPYDTDIVGAYSITGISKENKEKIIVDFLYNSNGVTEVYSRLESGKSLNVNKEKITESIQEIINRLKEKQRKSIENLKKQRDIEIILMIDTSGSMSGNPFEEAKESAKEFVEEVFKTKGKVYISLVLFADKSKYLFQKKESKKEIFHLIDSMDINECFRKLGHSNLSKPITENYRDFINDNNSIIVLLTDGRWKYQKEEIESSNIARDKEIIIYAIGFGAANDSFLKKISGGRGKKVDLNQLRKVFKEVANSIAREIN